MTVMYTVWKVKYLKISSYLKLCVGAGFSLGLLIGLVQLLFLFLMRATEGHSGASGMWDSLLAGLANAAGTVIVYTFGAAVISLISYFPFMAFLKRKQGIKIEGILEPFEESEIRS
ncbi:hypothetical protein M2298_000312 [Brevibacillus sp. 1238]|nr:hypothetical protein [Brevibacillus sp. 1238]